jgi:DnaD/phage-associated family protein
MSYKLNLEGGAAVIPLSALNKLSECVGSDECKALCLMIAHGLASRDFDTVVAEISGAGLMSEEKLRLAAAYWHGSGVLSQGGASARPSPVPAARNEKLITGADAETVTADKICNWIDNDARLRSFVKTCEDIFGAVFNPTELTVILTFSKEYRLPDECIFMVLGYCHDNGYSIIYAKKLFTRLVDNGITTVEGTHAELEFIASHNTYSTEVKTIFGINRAFTSNEAKIVEKWQKEYAFTPEVIRLAFDRAAALEKATIGYCNKILIGWREEKLVSADEIRAYLEKKKENYQKKAASTKPTENSSFSTDDFFAAAVNRSYKKKSEKKN